MSMDYFLTGNVLQKSAVLLFIVELEAFQPNHAIYAVCANELLANNDDNINAVKNLLSILARTKQPIIDKMEKCKHISNLVTQLPNLKETTWGTVTFKKYCSKKLPDVILLAGFDISYIENGKAKYKQIQRYVKGVTKTNYGKMQQQQQQQQHMISLLQKQQMMTSSQQHQFTSSLVPSPSYVPSSLSITSCMQSSMSDLISPLGSLSLSSTISSPISSLSSSSSSSSLAIKPTAFKSSSNAVSSFSKLTSMKETRLTSKAKQDDREMKTTWNGVRSAAYKISSILYDLNKKGRLKRSSITMPQKLPMQ